MALFKIFNNFSSSTSIQNMQITHNAGYCYFDKTTGKFWVDTSSNAADMLQLGGTFFGTCSSTANTGAKVVEDCPGFVLYTGASIYVKFTNTNTSSIATLTLNVNGTGARPIKQYGSTNLPSADVLSAGMICNFVFDGTNWLWVGQMNTDTNTVPSAYCATMSNTSAKTAICTDFTLQDNSYIHILFVAPNTSAGAITLNINNTGAKLIYINGQASGQTNNTLPAGTYLAFYDGEHYQIRTDGVLPGKIAGNVASITNDGSTIIYTMGDGTTASFVVPNTQYTAGSSISISGNQIINTGVRAIGQGGENGTISVNTNGTTKNVAIKGLKSAAYEDAAAFASAIHAHGNISSGGAIDMTDVSVANGDTLLVADASDSNKIVKTDLAFDGTTTNKFLSQAGTWEGAEAYSHPAYTARSEGLYKITVDNKGHVSNVSNVGKSDITALGIPAQDTTYEFDGDYNVNTNKAATVNSIVTRIQALDGTITGTPGAGKTLTTFSETDGKVSATFSNISITKSQISDFDHTHSYAGAASSGGNAYTANYAITASNAINASNATNAVEAIHAMTATWASSASFANNATTASNAINAANAVTATNAINAANATNATNATNANTATTAGNAVYAASAGYASSANTANTSGTASWAITANYAKTAGNANTATTAGAAVTAGNAISALKDGSNNVISETYATKSEVNALLGGADAMIFKGTIGTGGTVTSVPISGYQAGHTYRVITAGTYANQKCEVGDLLIAIADGPASGTSVTNAHWTVAQTNIDGAVTTTQTSATSGSFAIFTGTNGKQVMKASGVGSATKPIYIDSNGVPQTITSYEGKANTAGTADFAKLAGTATYSLSATCATNATNAGNANYAGTATFAKSAMSASHANNAGNSNYAGTATYAINAGSAVNATNASYAGTATYALSSGSAGYATNANNASYAGTATFAKSANSASHATNAGSAALAGTATYSISAGSAGYAANANNATNANNAVTASNAVYAATAGYAGTANTSNTSGTATYAKGAGTAAYASSAGYAATAGYATTAGNATDATKVAKTGDTMSGDLIFATTANGVTPAIIFQRGTLTDNYNDWRIQDSGGLLYFGQRGSGSTDFDTNISFNNSGQISAKGFLGQASCAAYAGSANCAAHATHAGSAGYATNANTANAAITASNALTAASAGSAGYATNAGSASHAGSAGYAANANTSNYAVTASNALKVNGHSVAVDVPSNAKFTDTWVANSLGVAGYVAAPTTATANKVWKTDANGNPSWMDDANTQYSAISQTEARGGTATTARLITAAVLRNSYTAYSNSAGYAGTAGTATFAKGAGTAQYASSATFATNATNATEATHAGTAIYATSAGYAGTANTSNTSGTATFAKGAGTAQYANSAGYAANAASASYASSATHAAHSSSADYVVNALYTYDRSSIGTAPNFDNPGVNGLFEVRNSTETTGETGTKPFNGYGPMLSIKTPDNVAMLQLAGSNSVGWYIRGKQASGVTLTDVPWQKVVTNSGSWAISAASATWAGSAGYAAKANTANYAVTATNAKYASSATWAGSANFATTATNAKYATSASWATSATWAGSAGYAATAAKATSDGSGNNIVNTYATKDEVSGLLALSDAMTFKGTIGTGGTITAVPANSYKAGATYKVITTATYAGFACEPGDLLIAIANGPTSGTTVTNTHWTVAQTNIDGAVTGPASATSGAFAIFSNATGKTVVNAAGKGSASVPIYIDSNGRPAAITSLSITATNAGAAGTALSAGSASYAASAGNSNTSGTATFAKGAGTAQYASSAGYAGTAGSSNTSGTATFAKGAGTAQYANSAGYAGSAASATWAASAGYAASAAKIGTANVGNYLNPIYLASGAPTASAGNTIPFIVGTGTTAGTWLGELTGLTAYTDGLLILYKPIIAGASTTTLNLNSLGAKTIYTNSTGKLTTHYPANQPILLVYSSSQNSGCWMCIDNYDSNTYTSAYCSTAASTAAKAASASGWTATAKSYIHVIFTATNTAASPTLNINGTGAKPIYVNGAAATTSNLVAGSYLAYYDGTNYQLRTDGLLPGLGTVGSAASAGWATSAGYAAGAGTATYATTALYAASASYASTANTSNYAITATNAKFATSANYAGSAGFATTATCLTTNAGSATQPVYFSGGKPVAANAYSSLLTSVAWTGGTTAGPVVNVVVGGTTKTAAIPAATTAASGVVTTTTQAFNGNKTFVGDIFKVQANEIRFRNTKQDNSAAGTCPYVTSLNIGDGRETTIDEYGDGYLAIHSKYGLVFHTASTDIPVYSNTATYNVGAIVWYNRAYYRCINAITEAEEWTSGNWQNISAGSGQIKTDATILPIVTETKDIGSTSLRWNNIYGKNENLSGTLLVSGATTHSGAVNIVGDTTVAKFKATGASTFTSAVNVGGATTLASTLSVAGATTHAGAMNIVGDTTVAKFKTTGASTFGAAVNVAGATTLASTLLVSGAATYSGAINAVGKTTVAGGLVGTSNLYGDVLPSSGVEGQVFFQASNGSVYELPAGGTTGQALVKSSNADRAVTWGSVGGVQSPNTTTKFYPSGSSSTTQNTNPALFNTAIYVQNSVLYGACWNDYAEFRQLKEDIEIPYGYCVCENGDDTLSLSIERMQPAPAIVSDTFGYAIGETEKAKVPIAVSGRVLVYPYEDRNNYKPGDCVCAGPEGKVCIMTREEIKEYPDRIVGIVSAVPDYDIWGQNNISVNGRIWVKVR